MCSPRVNKDETVLGLKVGCDCQKNEVITEPDPVVVGVGTVNVPVTEVYPVPTRMAPAQLELYSTLVMLVTEASEMILLGLD